jgi:hypothetical protein
MFTDIKIILMEFFRICLLQRKPQDLPASRMLLTVSLVSYTAANVLLALDRIKLSKAVQAGVLETVLVTIITLVILRLSRYGKRWLQTLTALAGMGCIMGLLALPIFYGSTHVGADTLLRVVMFLLDLGLLTWNVVVMAHILRHALDTSFAFGIIFALVYIFITSIIINLVVPELGVA